MDNLTPRERSMRMSLVRCGDTKPEMVVRRMAHSLGYRYRLHVGKMPGRPDLVFLSRRKVVFVHGCFWHRHQCAMGDRMPKSRTGFWRHKLEGNRARDERTRRELRRMGWRVLVVWECQTRDLGKLAIRLRKFLG